MQCPPGILQHNLQYICQQALTCRRSNLVLFWQVCDEALCVQVPIKLLHPTSGKFERLAETAQPTMASLNFVQTVCAQARYYYASKEKDYQLVMRNIWKGLLQQLGGVSRPAVGRDYCRASPVDLALAVSDAYAHISQRSSSSRNPVMQYHMWWLLVSSAQRMTDC